MRFFKLILFYYFLTILANFYHVCPVIAQDNSPPLLYNTNIFWRDEADVLKKINISILSAENAKEYFMPGKLWTVVARRGEIEIKAAVLYKGIAVFAIHFDPINGSLLPCGVHPPVYHKISSLIINKIKENLSCIVKELKILKGAEFRERENCWVIPIVYHEIIVAHLKVYRDGIHIIPDYKAEQEMKTFTN